MKDKYLEYARKNFEGKVLELIINQIELFYMSNNYKITKNKYLIGDDVFLKKDTFIHGIFPGKDVFNYTVDNGFVAIEFSDNSRKNKISNSVGMWKIKEDILLKDYINKYSGFTITYSVGRGSEAKQESRLIPYHQFDIETEKINNDNDIWTYWGDRTKEVSFLPSLVSDKRQIGFIINTDSDYAKKMIESDVWNTSLDEKTLESFLDYRYYPKFLDLRFNRDASTTDRESAIIFGLPQSLIEGVLVGRKLENNEEKLSYIKSKLTDCYICNLDGKVIVGNK